MRSGCRPGSRRRSSGTASGRCSRTTTGTGDPTCTSRTTRIPTSSTRTFSGPAELPRIPKGSASASRSAAPPRESRIRTPAWASRPAITTATGASTSSSRTRGGSRTPCCATGRARERRPSRTGAPHSAPPTRAPPAGARPGSTSPATAGPTSSSPAGTFPLRTWPRTSARSGSCPTFVPLGHRRGTRTSESPACAGSRGSTAADWLRPTTTTTAPSTSPSRRSAAGSCFFATAATPATGSRSS